MKRTAQRILAVVSFAMAIAGFGAFANSADAFNDPTQSRWYRATNWVDKPPVQRYINQSRQLYQDNKAVIWGTFKDAARGKSLPYVVPKALFGYPKDAISR